MRRYSKPNTDLRDFVSTGVEIKRYPLGHTWKREARILDRAREKSRDIALATNGLPGRYKNKQDRSFDAGLRALAAAGSAQAKDALRFLARPKVKKLFKKTGA